jgi:hypothetical protein
MANTNTTETKETKETKKPKMVKIKLPLTRTEKNDEWVSVNGNKYLIKRGVEVEVPDFVAEVLKHKEEMLDIAMAYEAAASANAGAYEIK